MKSQLSLSNSKTKMSVIRIALGVALMFVCAQVQIPLEPVPVTMQTVGVLIIALTYSRKEAVSAMATYLALGAMGAPVFAGFHAGYQVFLLSTGGYLMGMLLAVYVVTTLRQKYGEPNLFYLFLYSVLGSACVFMIGLPWLATLIGVEKAIQFGLIPFIIPGIVKAMFTAATVRLFKGKMKWLQKS